MSNRVTKYAAMVKAKVEALGDTTLDGTSWEDADADMAISSIERAAYQQAQVRAYAERVLTMDEAMTVYRAIGESGSGRNGGWPMRTSYPMKVAVTALMGQLIAGRS